MTNINNATTKSIRAAVFKQLGIENSLEMKPILLGDSSLDISVLADDLGVTEEHAFRLRCIAIGIANEIIELAKRKTWIELFVNLEIDADKASLQKITQSHESIRMANTVDINSGIKSFRSLMDSIDLLREIGSKTEDYMLSESISDLLMNAANASLELTDIVHQLLEIKKENSDLKKQTKSLNQWDISHYELHLINDDLLYSEFYRVFLCPNCLMKKTPEALIEEWVQDTKVFSCSSITCNFTKHIETM
ncbi:MAG: hypothetical protein WA902_00940 [Thermosynechococcaceae cyanobacterium]